MMKTYDFQSSHAFVDCFELPPYRSGPLDGMRFALKDNIEVQGRRCSFGSPAWREAHPPAAYHALCVEQLLAAGAHCVGKTVTDEFTYSLDGENHFYGTPLNPRAPERIPGGSSSGSASAVACGLVDFALGTDCGGSVRVPASLCGVFGMRPSTHRISEAGVLPFAPSVSTVGVLARELVVLQKSMHVLLRSQHEVPLPLRRIYLLNEAFALADAEIQHVLSAFVEALRHRHDLSVDSVSLADITALPTSLRSANVDALRVLQTAEIANAIGGWLREHEPQRSPNFEAAFANVERFDRSTMSGGLELCETLFARVATFLRPGELFCYPTAPVLAPKKGTLHAGNLPAVRDFYDRTMAVTSFAGVARLPELTLPVSEVDGVPVGLSFAAAHRQDEFLIAAATQLWTHSFAELRRSLGQGMG